MPRPAAQTASKRRRGAPAPNNKESACPCCGWPGAEIAVPASRIVFANTDIIAYSGERGALIFVIAAEALARDDAPLSGSGKSRLLATTGQAARIRLDGRALSASLNVYAPAAVREPVRRAGAKPRTAS